MGSFFKTLIKRILFNLCVFFIGFRFYFSSQIAEEDELYDCLTIPRINSDLPLVFNFYKTKTEFYQYRLGRVKNFHQVRYSIIPKFEDPKHPDLFTNYNNRPMTFHIPYADLISDRSLSRFLLDMYLTYVIMGIRKNSIRIKEIQPTKTETSS